MGVKGKGSRGNRWGEKRSLIRMAGKYVVKSWQGSEHNKSKTRADPKSKSARTQKQVRTGKSKITKTHRENTKPTHIRAI